MRNIITSIIFAIAIISIASAQSISRTSDYEGDYFSLEGALELFRESTSLRSFERAINSSDSYINNLDLNYDNQIDYVRVEHRSERSYHIIILQAQLGRREVQDVAVIEIENLGGREAFLQIIGDPDLYGEELIIEPTEGSREVGYNRSSTNYSSSDYVNVYYWPIVQNMLAPRYIAYRSPYRWSYYPTWWRSWRPYAWNVFYPRIRPYYRNCVVVNVYRSPRVHRYYRARRSYSPRCVQLSVRLRNNHRYTSSHRRVIDRSGTVQSRAYGSRKANTSTRSTDRVNSSRRSAAYERTSQQKNTVVKPRTSSRDRSPAVSPKRRSTIQNPAVRQRGSQAPTRQNAAVRSSKPSQKKYNQRSNAGTYRKDRSPAAKAQRAAPQRSPMKRQSAKQSTRKSPASSSRNFSSRNNRARSDAGAYRPRQKSNSSQRMTPQRPSTSKARPSMQRKSQSTARTSRSSSVRPQRSQKSSRRTSPSSRKQRGS